MIGLVAGGVIGWLRPDWGNAVYFLRDIFINLIKSIIAPLVFSTIVVGIAGAGALRKVGRMGIKALIYFEIVTTAALFIGLAVVNFTKPGVGVTLAAANTDIIKTIGQSSPADFRRNDRARFSLQRDRSHGARRCFANRRIQRAFRTRGLGGWRKRKTNHPGDGQPVADHVQVYKLRDDVCTDWGRRSDGAHDRHAGSGRADESRQIDRLALSGSGDFHLVDLWTGDLDRAYSVAAIRQGGARACGARIRDHEQRIGVAESNGIDGAIRRAAAHRRFRDADRLFVQPHRIDIISGNGLGVRGASGRDDNRMAHVDRPTDHDDVDVDADFEGRGRCAAVVACDFAGRTEFVCAVRPGTDRRGDNFRCG